MESVGEGKVQIEMNDIHHCCLVTTSPSAMVHLILMLKNGAGEDMSAHTHGCRPLIWVVVVFSSPVKSSFFTSKRGNWQPQLV